MRSVFVGFTGLLLLGLLCYGALLVRAEPIQADIRARALGVVAGADWAELVVDGRDLRIYGKAPSKAERDGLLEAARALPGVRKVSARIGVEPRVSPYVWQVSRSPEAILLTGVVPDKASQRDLKDLAQRIFGRPVQDQTRIALGAPSGWQEAARFAIRQLAAVRQGEAVLHDTDLRFSSDDRLAAGEIEAAAGDALAGSFNVDVALAAGPDGEPLSMAECQKRIDETLSGHAIVFASGRSEPTPESRILIESLADRLAGCESLRFRVAGHTDASGSEDLNRKLSESRAQAVAGALAGAGFEDARLRAIGYGSSQPVADNASPAGRALNRRIEITAITQIAAGN